MASSKSRPGVQFGELALEDPGGAPQIGRALRRTRQRTPNPPLPPPRPSRPGRARYGSDPTPGSDQTAEPLPEPLYEIVPERRGLSRDEPSHRATRREKLRDRRLRPFGLHLQLGVDDLPVQATDLPFRLVQIGVLNVDLRIDLRGPLHPLKRVLKPFDLAFRVSNPRAGQVPRRDPDL